MYTPGKHDGVGLNASSMADIAFLLLTFFMVTTVMKEEKGLALLLPPLNPDAPAAPVHERNLFKVQLNSYDQLLVEGEPRTGLAGLRDDIKAFILNNGRSSLLSDSPASAVVSLKADRGTSHKVYIATLDEIQAAYYELYAAQAGLAPDEFRTLDLADPRQRAAYEKGRKGVPMNISIAEPSQAPAP